MRTCRVSPAPQGRPCAARNTRVASTEISRRWFGSGTTLSPRIMVRFSGAAMTNQRHADLALHLSKAGSVKGADGVAQLEPGCFGGRARRAGCNNGGNVQAKERRVGWGAAVGSNPGLRGDGCERCAKRSSASRVRGRSRRRFVLTYRPRSLSIPLLGSPAPRPQPSKDLSVLGHRGIAAERHRGRWASDGQ